MKLTKTHLSLSALSIGLILTGVSGCNKESTASVSTGITPKIMSDSLHAVMVADRTVYTKQVVGRLVKKEKVIKASEQFEDDKALPLPAQMFRFGSEHVAESNANFSYSLLSLWPINKQNSAKTEAEKIGLKHIFDNPGENYYTEETLGGTKYFTAVYPDVGVAPVCVSCHNEHKDTPKTDFKIGDVMGGVVIRIPI